MYDLISRQAAIDAIKELCQHYTHTKSVNHQHMNFVIEELENLPSTQPERKKGKWIVPVPRGSVISYSRAYWECDQCHKATFFGNEMNFCPNCGADMRGEHNG